MDNTPQKQLIMIHISLLSTRYNNSVIAGKVIKAHPEIPSKHTVLLFSYHSCAIISCVLTNRGTVMEVREQSEQHADELVT